MIRYNTVIKRAKTTGLNTIWKIKLPKNGFFRLPSIKHT